MQPDCDDSDAELARALKLVEKLLPSDSVEDVKRLAAQARLIAGYEQLAGGRGRRAPPMSIRYLMDLHGLSRADMVPILGTRAGSARS